jgi:superfamily II DNA or RNA helicase
MIEHRSSFSQHNTFQHCERNWYYSHVLKLQATQDMSYADAGNVIHKCLEIYYKDKTKPIEEIKDVFEFNWKSKKLNNGILQNKKDKYWLMCVNGINLSKEVTSTEFTIFYPEIVAHLDCINTTDHEIYDWKSSSQRSEDNMKEYKKQMILYSWLYYRKFNVLPKKCIVYYLSLNNSNQEFEIIPTMNDLFEIEDWYFNILKKMINYKENNNVPPRCIDEGKECNFFCPYKDLCCNNNEGELKLQLEILGNYIKINGPVSPLLHKGINKKFSYTLKDAVFIEKRLREKYPDRQIHYDGVIKFYNTNKQVLPLGFMKELLVTLSHYVEHKKLQLNIEIKDKRLPYSKTITIDKELKLRDYQIKAVEEFLKHKISLLEIGTGGGKTEIAIECIKRLGCKTLFIVDRVELLKQTKKRIEDNLGIEVGQIGHGIDDIKDITVGTVQTLVKNITKYSTYLQSIQFVIYDECHKTPAKSYFLVSQHLVNTNYRMGLSGTAFRDDGNDMYINAICGYKCFDLSAKTLIDNGWLVKPNITFIKKYMTERDIEECKRNSMSGLINETEKFNMFYHSFITKNKLRNNIIKDLIDKNKDKKILILVKHIEHGQILSELLGVKYLHGSTKKEEREEIFNNFKSGINNVMIGTISIFSEGIDIPDLHGIINASGNKGDVKTIQILGRVLRKILGKENCFYYDFIDESRFFYKASRSRINALKREGHYVEVVEWNNGK